MLEVLSSMGGCGGGGGGGGLEGDCHVMWLNGERQPGALHFHCPGGPDFHPVCASDSSQGPLTSVTCPLVVVRMWGWGARVEGRLEGGEASENGDPVTGRVPSTVTGTAFESSCNLQADPSSLPLTGVALGMSPYLPLVQRRGRRSQLWNGVWSRKEEKVKPAGFEEGRAKG